MLMDLGGKLRKLHLLESDDIEDYITQYPIDGDNVVGKPLFIETTRRLKSSKKIGLRNTGEKTGKVYINETQYFDNVPEQDWNFYIGGYQPAQKWLKDRKGRELGFEDILHYQKMIVALNRTGELMKEIDWLMLQSEHLSAL